MDQVTGLTTLLEADGATLRFFDVGRRVAEIPRAQFLEFERNELAYPLPLKNQAWFAVCRIYDEKPADPVIWFLRLPLDEQGKLVLAARDYFIHRMLDALSQHQPVTADPLESAFKDNPHTFKPREDRLAVFHALMATSLDLPPSSYYIHAQDYFCGKKGWEQWQFVGYQGIADLAARINAPENRGCVTSALSRLPDEPLIALCHCLENQALDSTLADVFIAHLRHIVGNKASSSGLVSALVRALSLSSADHRQQMLDLVMDSPWRNDIEVLVSISGRAWELLLVPGNAGLFLDALAENPGGQPVFEQCIGDLFSVPGMREPLLAAAEDEDRTELLAQRMRSLRENLGN